MHFDSEIYSSNMALGWPEGLRFPNAIILAHELTHVWQWQNREVTGYTAMRAMKESWQIADPYYSASGGGPAFFSYGYEQQAAMVEDPHLEALPGVQSQAHRRDQVVSDELLLGHGQVVVGHGRALEEATAGASRPEHDVALRPRVRPRSGELPNQPALE